MTVAEYTEWLKQSGKWDEFVERRRVQEEARLQREVEYQRAEAPLVEELRGAGYLVDSAWDLVNTHESYATAVPILLAHLPRPYPGPVREGIARALAVPEAKVGWRVLTQMYRDEENERAKHGLAIAIAVTADADVIGEVIDRVRDVRHGESRIFLLMALERSSDRRAHATLTELASDPDLKKEIRVILRRRRGPKR